MTRPTTIAVLALTVAVGLLAAAIRYVADIRNAFTEWEDGNT